MAEFVNVVIGIQARSTSERFPRKWAAMLEGKQLLQHTIDSANWCAKYINKHSLKPRPAGHAGMIPKKRVVVQTVLAIPDGDELATAYRGVVPIISGPEHDVLERYRLVAERLDADYVVRVTGDCPLVPSHLIRKHIITATENGYDYTSNVDEETRTAPDGYDCEVISRRLLDYVAANAHDKYDREHVTPMMRREPPEWATTGNVVPDLALDWIKLSIDTPEDLAFLESMYGAWKKKYLRALEKYGDGNVHRY
jgi:spore coat polysaccharide biosynthesis protein SpsF